MGGWMDGWVDGRVGLRIAYSNQKSIFQNKIRSGLTQNSTFLGKNELLQALNKRLFIIIRISNHIPKDNLKLVANSMWMLKMRYGLQLTNKVRLSEDDKKSKDIKATQIAQNKLLRLMDGS